MIVKYRCLIPGVPGDDLCHPSRESAEREAKAARKQGLDARIIEVLVRPRRVLALTP